MTTPRYPRANREMGESEAVLAEDRRLALDLLRMIARGEPRAKWLARAFLRERGISFGGDQDALGSKHIQEA